LPTRQETFFENIKSSLAEQLFAVVNLKYHAADTYDFGFVDLTKFTGPITYVNVNSNRGLWGFAATSYSVCTAAAVEFSINSIIDSGTTLIFIDPAIASAYYAKVSGARISKKKKKNRVATCSRAVLPCPAFLSLLTALPRLCQAGSSTTRLSQAVAGLALAVFRIMRVFPLMSLVTTSLRANTLFTTFQPAARALVLRSRLVYWLKEICSC
jgi:hypothetical protein